MKIVKPTPAERILLELGINSPEDIDLEAIAWSLGAAVDYEPLDGCEALIVGSNNNAVIVVNSESSDERKRFSISHEIGHWHHHRGKTLFCANGDVGNPGNSSLNPERQADDFASDLILPNYMIVPVLNRIRRITLSSVREVANQFKASVTATFIKIVKSGDFPIVLVCHNTAGRRWSWPSKVVPGWWRLRPDLDPESFAYDLMFKGSSEERWPRKIGADAWFDFKGCGRYEVEEQSFWVARDESLTVLTIPDNGLGG